MNVECWAVAEVRALLSAVLVDRDVSAEFLPLHNTANRKNSANIRLSGISSPNKIYG